MSGGRRYLAMVQTVPGVVGWHHIYHEGVKAFALHEALHARGLDHGDDGGDPDEDGGDHHGEADVEQQLVVHVTHSTVDSPLTFKDFMSLQSTVREEPMLN